MLDIIKDSLSVTSDKEEKGHRLREALQVLVLKILSDANILGSLAFVGGTALRLLFDLRRFSEDLDFSLINKQSYDFKKLEETLRYQLGKYGFAAELVSQEDKTVNSILIKFPQVLHEAGLSGLKSQKLAIKLEIDTNPPQGYGITMSAISSLYIFTLTHYDLQSLYASKLHACFYRKYIKGRDFYDLLWYIGKKVNPNFLLLNNAIKQTQGKDVDMNEDNFAELLKARVLEVDFKKVREDAGRFLIDKAELKLLDKETFLKIIK